MLHYSWLSQINAKAVCNGCNAPGSINLPVDLPARLSIYRPASILSVAQLDDFSHLYWDLYIDHLHIFRNPDSREI